ncbi:MAG: isoleucine--tRNA ligase [Gemmatimonadetes bacterium]|jgi:isoleucyl-tRNA synthetase|nr:isoleucine--tRNA ligase [Gemmatimonadota bacterium]MBT5802402.1 isoleucine--tRNA ligase [Gemmatimonadota bacterium]MBT6619786.1 isoleucine--tRNA ligase [Gemmatimonadota bacterium]MBT7419348.1 isoleucine--tRNA ligase [Gemmatimonadota bacterium]MBT7586850.1 isoleucine--tRNA ligase [Gemmatimonadota bacterium]
MSNKKTRFAAVPTSVDFPAQEEQILAFWEEGQHFARSVAERPEDKPFIFYDGPPFASGLPHYGHLLASIIKDVVPRYWTMRGFRVERRFGWDCHGLPVENEVEQQLGLKSRLDILDYGVDKFNESCRDVVLRYTGEWQRFIQRVGRWVDWSNQYRTMDPEFMESVWWVFKTLWDKELIYEGYKSLAYCPRCSTPLSNFEVNQGYQDTQDPSVTIRFKVQGEDKLSILAWTTTPWTLPSNMALAVGRDIDYVRVTLKDGEQLILAKALVQQVFKKQEDEIASVEVQPVDELLQMRYEPLFAYFADKAEEGAFRVVVAEFVSTENGTGVVHTAPGFGEEDYQLGLREGLPLVSPIDKDCCFTDEVPDYEGRFVKDVDRDIIRLLRETGQLFAESTIEHSYPFCWRCDTPLIYRTISTWFVNVEKIKPQMLAANAQIWWVPEHIKAGRFGRWLEGARDWSISRNRYWGTPLPIWRNEETGETVCIGSREELVGLCGSEVDDLHKHVIDLVEIPSPTGRGTLKRVPEVLDCWFESGSMPYAQNHYPFENKEDFDANFPADFISEGLDQTRGWFYTLTVLCAALFDKPAFKNCIVSGMLLAEDGRKMSKRLKNYPEPTEMIDKYGADALRLYLLNSPALKAEEMRMTESGIKESLRAVIIPLWNSYSFFATYAALDGWSPEDGDQVPQNRLDRWVLSELQTLIHELNTEMEAYRLYRTVPAMVAFVEKLTNWYIRRSRRRFWKSEDDQDKAAAYATLYRVLVTFVKALAPVLPFITESIYQNLVCRVDESAPDSVHLCDMPQADESLRDAELEEQMELATRAVVLGRSLRSKHDLKVRQPLRSLYLLPPDEHSRYELGQMVDLLADELNIKEVVMVEDETDLSEVSYRPNFRVLGPRFGKQMKEVGQRIGELTQQEIEILKAGDKIAVAGGEIGIEDVEVQRREKEGVVVAIDNNLGVGLDVQLDDELVAEGVAREIVNRVQNMRKDAGLEVSDRIRIGVQGEAGLLEAIGQHREYIAAETLALELSVGALPDSVVLQQELQVNDYACTIAIARA